MRSFILACIVGLLVSPFFVAGVVILDGLVNGGGALARVLIQAYIGGVLVTGAVLSRRKS